MHETRKNKPILSISLLSAGRKETIWKCLDSLKPLQEALETELIIVDTGCDEETQEKMKKYTNHIIPFTWCNDFSKARNTGLKEAKGKWFLFIDDDEWFTDVTEIIEFFQSGEYKNYGCANYIQRNYTHSSGKVWQDSWVTRMIRLEKDTHFRSSIHEHLYPIRGKCKLLHSPVDHYGYIFKDNKTLYEHSKRNSTLLIDMIKKERKNPRWWVHLAQEYKGIKEYNKLEELCLEGIEVFSSINQSYVNKERGTFYAGIVMVDLYREDYEKAYADIEKFLEDLRVTEICRARLHGYGAKVCFHLKRYEECQVHCQKYLELYEKYHSDEMKILEEGGFFVREVFREEQLNHVYCYYIESALKEKNPEVLLEYFHKIDWFAERLHIWGGILPDIVEAMATLPYRKEFIDILKTLLKRKGVVKRVIAEIKNKYEKNGVDKEEFLRLCKIISQIDDTQHHYIIYMKFLFAKSNDDTEQMEQCLHQLFSKVINFWELNDSIFEIAVNSSFELDTYLTEIKFDHWKNGVDILFKIPKREKISLRSNFLQSVIKSSNLRYDYFFMKESEAKLRMINKEDVQYGDIVNLLKDFTNRYLEFYHKFYKEEAFCGEMELLPTDCRLAVKLSKVFKEERNSNLMAMMEALKECRNVHPILDDVINIMMEYKKQEVKEAGENRKQLLILGEQIKAQILILLENRMYVQAYDVLNKLKALIPNDPELVTLEEKIREGLS